MKNSLALRVILALGAIASIAISARNLPAGFHVGDESTSVEIDGKSFGVFDSVKGIDGLHVKNGRVALNRDFVTDPSLYLWAKNTIEERRGLKDIHLVKRNKSGEEVSRYVLKLCQPLSWSVESANPTQGGFHEKVEFAVQSLEVY